MTDEIERVARDRADWLLDAVACATQNRRFLRGDPDYDEVAGEAILLNGEKAIQTAIASIRKDDELREVLEKLNALRRLCDSCQQDFYVEIIDEITSALSSVAGGGGHNG